MSFSNEARKATEDFPFWAWPLLFIAFLILVFPFILLGGLIFQVLWNLGVVALVAACGGSVAKIGFWTAVVGNLALGHLARLLRGNRNKPEAAE